MKKIIIILFLMSILIFLPDAFAAQGHMKLLAVRETEAGMEGGIADLYLEIKPGSGRVFLETFPLTKTDTQMSTRFAKAIACDLVEEDCDDTDFFYTITADSAIIAGPSAGSSIALLTVAMLENLDLNDEYAMTGTINSGGLIGPVGGLKPKIEAGKKAGLKKVLIPQGEIIAKIGNTTVDLKNFSMQLGIDAVEVSTLSEAVKHFTGRDIKQKFRNIEISQEYKDTMKSLAKSLCDRSSQLKEEASNLKYPNISALRDAAGNLTIKGKGAFERQVFYSSASYCFGANVEYSTIILLSKNLSKGGLLAEIAKTKKSIMDFEKKIDAVERKTITDLEAYFVVKERLAEAEEYAEEAAKLVNITNKTQRISGALAYASERINSAYSWAAFLGKSGRQFNLNKDVLKKSCQNKISEAYERKEYVELYYPSTLGSIQKGIEKATEELEKGNYELCLSKASKAKADIDLILNFFGVESEQYGNLLERKLEIVKNSIGEQTSKGVFPILSYSYYEYANSLKETDTLSALLYSEYALEYSNLGIYFREEKAKSPRFDFRLSPLGIFIIGVLVGAAAFALIKNRKPIAENSKRKRKRI